MFVCDLLVGLAESPRVVALRPLGTLPLTLGYFALDPWVLSVCSLLAFCLLLACRDARMRLYRWGLPFLFVCLLACRDAARHVSTGRWFFRVSPLGRYIGWAAFLGPPRYGLLWWGRSFIRRPKVNLPARRICPRRDVWLFVVQYVKPVGCLCLSGCRDAARHVSIGELAFSQLCVETRFRVLAS